MAWKNSLSLSGVVIELEDAERRFAAGERSAALRQTAMRICKNAAACAAASQQAWQHEIMARAQRLIDVCS